METFASSTEHTQMGGFLKYIIFFLTVFFFGNINARLFFKGITSKVNNIFRMNAKIKFGLAAIFKPGVFFAKLLTLRKHLKIIDLLLLDIERRKCEKKDLTPKPCDLNWHVHHARQSDNSGQKHK